MGIQGRFQPMRHGRCACLYWCNILNGGVGVRILDEICKVRPAHTLFSLRDTQANTTLFALKTTNHYVNLVFVLLHFQEKGTIRLPPFTPIMTNQEIYIKEAISKPKRCLLRKYDRVFANLQDLGVRGVTKSNLSELLNG